MPENLLVTEVLASDLRVFPVDQPLETNCNITSIGEKKQLMEFFLKGISRMQSFKA